MKSLLDQVSVTDPLTLAAVSLAAGIRRAARLLPSRAPGDEGGPAHGVEV